MYAVRSDTPTSMVLIESDWNLKVLAKKILKHYYTVLIESDWNLKYIVHYKIESGEYCINRIRLEFKGWYKSQAYQC